MKISEHIPFGRHIIAELFPDKRNYLNDVGFIELSLHKASLESGASVLNIYSHQFQPEGVTTLVLLAESHVSIHTYPAEGVAFFDAFTCGMEISPLDILSNFSAACGDCRYTHKQFNRNPFKLQGIDNVLRSARYNAG